MKILAIGDPHFKASNILDTNILIKNVVKIALYNSPDIIVILGDLLDTHEKIHTLALKQVTRFLLKLRKIAKTFVLIGNHDYINNSQYLTNNHPFNPFKSLDNLVIVDKVIEYQKLIFLPYTPPGRLVEALNSSNFNWKTSKIIFGHQEIYGCLYNPDTTSSEGDIWLKEYPLLVSGHIHTTSWIGKNVYYPGASTQVKINETDPKTVSLISFTNSESKIKINTCPLHIPIKQTIYLDIDQIKNFIPQESIIYRIILKCESNVFNQFKKTDTCKKLINLGHKISFNEPDKDFSDITIDGSQKKSLVDILSFLIKDDPPLVKHVFDEITQNN